MHIESCKHMQHVLCQGSRSASLMSIEVCEQEAGSGGSLPLTSLRRGEGCKPEQVGCRDGGRRRLRTVILLQGAR